MLENPSTAVPTPLIGPDDPAPYEIVNEGGGASILILCDHASRAVPAAMNGLGLDADALERHIAYDIGAQDIVRDLARRLDAQAVLAGYSRLLIDCNRQPGHPGSIPQDSDDTHIPGNRDLSEEGLEARADSFFWPYHHAITNVLARMWRSGSVPVVFSVHTFTPSLGGEDRYWDIGVLWNRDPRLAKPLMEKLRASDDLHVGDNQPYSGREVAYTIDLHGGSAGFPNCAVEIRQDLVEDRAGAHVWADLLHRALSDILVRDDLHREEHF